jgi:hypothetical protein
MGGAQVMRLFLLGLVNAYNYLLGFIGSTFSLLWGLIGLSIGGGLVWLCLAVLQTTYNHGLRLSLITLTVLLILFFGLRFLHRLMRAVPGFLPPGIRTYAPGDAHFAKVKDVRRSGLLKKR